MIYRSYQHVERLGATETNGILDGTCYIFPKIDGTNATVWLGDDNTLRAGSRKPDVMRGMIERISYEPRIELFAREAFPGWDAWGNEAPMPAA